MRKTINMFAGMILIVSLFVLFLQGFGLPPIGAVLDLILRFVAGVAAQVLFCANFKQIWLKIIPLVLTVAFSLWGGWLFLTSDSWVNATLGGYFIDYCTPAVGCAITYILSLINKK